MAGAKDSNSDNDDRISNQSTDSSALDEKKRGNEDSSPSSSSIAVEVSSCSICLELVGDDGIRSRAKLQCGHEFHLDCIGSAFNMKGAMQCPNCRNVEKGQWLYANGSTRSSFPEFVMEDWIHEEDLYGLTYPEMQYRAHWCPFGELSQASSFEEMENATTTYHNEFHGHHHHAAAAMNHSYLAYIAPNPIATPRTTDNNNITADDLPWNHQLAIAPQYHHHHHHHSPSFPHPGNAHIVDSEIDSSSVARGISYPQHPFLFSYRSNPRTSPAMQYHQRQQHGPNLVSVTRRGLPPPPPPPPMPDQNGGGFFIYPQPPPSSSETDQFHHTWERDWFPHFPVPSNHHHRLVSNVWNRHF